MKSFDTDLKKYAEKVNLKASERRELRERVLSYMEYHPLPKQLTVEKEIVGAIPSELFTTFHFTSFHKRIGMSVFALILIAAPFIAEKSVPGDVLYLVKTNFNETIQGQLANSPYEKIEFETKLMERRIAEARVLAGEGKLTEEVKTHIAETVKSHTTAVQSGLAELRTQDADGAAIAQIAFNSSLEVQSAVLDADGSEENGSLIESILTVVNDARDEVTLNQTETTPSFEGLSARVEKETTRAYELFTSIKISATPEEIADIERRLQDADRLIVEAGTEHEVNPEKAVSDLATTLGLIQKLIVFMTDIDIREAVLLETIVPIVLSDAERIDALTKAVTQHEALKVVILEQLPFVQGEGIVGKIEEGLVYADELLVRVASALETGELDTAENASKEVGAVLADIAELTEKHGVGPTPDDGEAPVDVEDGEEETPSLPVPQESETTQE